VADAEAPCASLNRAMKEFQHKTGEHLSRRCAWKETGEVDSSSQIRGKLIAVSKKDHTRVEESSSCVRGCRDQGEIMGDPGRSWESGWASDKVGDEVAVSDDEGVELLGVEVLDPHVWAASPIERISRGLHRKPPSAEWCRLPPPCPH